MLAVLRLSGLPGSGVRANCFDGLPQINSRRLVVPEIDLQPRSVCMIHDGPDRSVDNSVSVHVDLDSLTGRPTAKSFIFRSALSFLAVFFFASILFVPRPVESRTLPEVVGLDSF